MLDTEIVAAVHPEELDPAEVGREFKKLLASGVPLKPAGQAQDDPSLLLARRLPRYKLQLFDVTFWLTDQRFDDDLGFFVAYLRLGRRKQIHPRIFYKDVSLVWRCATHYSNQDGENWIGKGDLKPFDNDGEEQFYAAEETTNLPLELQGPLDVLSRRAERVLRDNRAVELVLRNAPGDRVEPYADFTGPRTRAMQDPGNLINDGRPVALFDRPGDPGSLRFVPGFEPDFASGVLETTQIKSRMYLGEVCKRRILSANRQIQYQFVEGPKHLWIVPPQTLTRELSSYGVRTVDVDAAEDLFVPGFEYHFMDESHDPPELHSQIPAGFAGPPSEVDPSRADASPWLEKLPVIQEYRRVFSAPRRMR